MPRINNMFDITKFCQGEKATCNNIGYNNLVTGSNDPSITKSMRYSQYLRSKGFKPVNHTPPPTVQELIQTITTFAISVGMTTEVLTYRLDNLNDKSMKGYIALLTAIKFEYNSAPLYQLPFGQVFMRSGQFGISSI